MSIYQFKQVDVFTPRPFFGNPVAVVLGADDIERAAMQRIAAWTNLSETTFVLRPSMPDADYRLRIFTPGSELPFAGHPTVGSAHAVLESGFVAGQPSKLRQECTAGILPLTVEGGGPERQIFVQVPEATIRQPRGDEAELLATVLGAPVSREHAPLAIDVGPVWLVAYFEDTEIVRGLRPDLAALARVSRDLQVGGVTVFSLGAENGAAAHVRSFAPDIGVGEDPVCGSGNATVAAYLVRTGLLERTGACYTASQGSELGRDGRVQVRVHDGGRRIEIGGCAVTTIDGTIRL
jgi:PhzF family phenazine biosynthesis protein